MLHYSFLRRISSGVCVLLLGVPTLAQSGDSSASALSLQDALIRTVEQNPALVASGYQIDAAEGRLQQARLAPNPELDVVVQDVLGTDDFRGINNAETTVSLSWILERGVRAQIIDAARADLSLQSQDVSIARLDVAAETARRFVTCLALQAQARVALEAVGLATETVAAVDERVAAGVQPEAELERAEAALARSEMEHESIEHELLTAYHRLSAQWGDTRPDFSAVNGDLRQLPRAESFDSLKARIEQSPHLSRFMTQQRLNEAELRLAQAQRKQNWRLSAGVRRFEGSDDTALMAGITIPLPVRNRNQGRIAEARANVAQTQAAAAATRLQIETTLFVLHQELQHDLHVAERLRRDVVPKIQSALAETESAYKLGRYSYFEWRAVQAELLAARTDLLDASFAAHNTVIEIERLTGVQIALPAKAE